jgi:hypothetical protein
MESSGAQRSATATQRSRRRVLVVAMDELVGGELVGELRDHLRDAGAVEVMVIAPAVEETAFQHALGDVDSATAAAGKRLEASMAELSRAGIEALGAVGDSDPVIAAADALQQFAAEEVLIVARAEDQARWFEDGLFERAQEELQPAVRMVTVRREEGEWSPHLAGIEESGPGRKPPPEAEHELVLSPNLPRFTPGDLAGIVIAIVGTVVVAILAATGPGVESAGGAAQILIAIAVSLVNLAHVVGLTIMESIRYRGGLQRAFRNLSTFGTPLAIVVNALITLLG